MREELRAFLRPEFLNRIDDVVLFRPLSKEDLRGIVDIQLRRLEKLVSDRELKLSLTDAAKDRLVDLGYEPAFGARPLKRAILKKLQDPLAEEILRGGYAPAASCRSISRATSSSSRRADGPCTFTSSASRHWHGRAGGPLRRGGARRQRLRRRVRSAHRARARGPGRARA